MSDDDDDIFENQRKWHDYAMKHASVYGLEWEVNEWFWKFINQDYTPAEAAQAALYEWDI